MPGLWRLVYEIVAIRDPRIAPVRARPPRPRLLPRMPIAFGSTLSD
jgi:hypothetical protein